MSLSQSRISWVDYAKGICIVLVVLMHSTLGVEKAAGEVSCLHGFIDWAKPFRMPDFFLISGLFLVARFVSSIYVFMAGDLLEMAPIETGYLLVDEFASRFSYFFAGYWLAGHVFSFAKEVNFKSVPAIFAGLFIWAVGNTVMVHNGYAHLPGFSLILGFIGAAAVVSTGVLGPVLLFWATRHTKLSLLFRGPSWVRLASRPAQWHSDGHVTFKQPEARGPSLSR